MIEKNISKKLIEQFDLEKATLLPDHYSNFLSDSKGDRVRIKQFYFEEERKFALWFQPGEMAMGAPGFCHGGLISTVLDESMGSLCWWNGHLVMTVNIDIRYKSKIPLNNQYIVFAWIKNLRGRRLFAEAEIYNEAGKTCAISSGIFLKVSPERLASDTTGENLKRLSHAVQFIELREKGVSVQETFDGLKKLKESF
jgi:acyl-coenzyme A thioesterase PaaI-like protein